MESNFKFLSTEYPILTNIGILAERYIHDDPNTTLFKLRLFGEKMVETIFEIHQLDFPYENTAFRRLELLKDEAILEDNILGLFHTIRKSGNQAVHAGKQVEESAMRLLFSSFKIAKWFYVENFLSTDNINNWQKFFNWQQWNRYWTLFFIQI